MTGRTDLKAIATTALTASAWLARVLAASLVLFGLGETAGNAAEPAASGARKVAANVPLPRAKPGPAARNSVVGAADPIAAVIGAAADEPGEPLAEDSDGPEATSPPESAAPPPAALRAPVSSQSKVGAAGFRMALDFLDKGDPAAATLAALALPDRIDTRIVDWLVATGGYDGVPAQRIADVARRLPDWPGQTLLRVRFEQALADEKPGSKAAIQALSGQTPVTSEGMILLAQAYLDSGRKKDAAALIRPYWRDGKFDEDVEAKLRKEFSGLLSVADHKARMDRLLYDEQTAAAMREAAVLGKDEKALAGAVVAVIKKQKPEKALAGVPKAKQKDPLYAYARIQVLRRADKLDDAAARMLAGPRDPKLLVDADAWWVERRLIARALIDKGDARTAYKLVAGHSAESSALRAEAEFHAGWIALEFLGDPVTARKHFLAVEAISSLPLTQSRAAYWLGRAAVAAGNGAEATEQFRRAGAYPTTFYGQLALARLGAKRLTLKAPPPASEALKASFAERELVQVIVRLTANNHDDRVDIFYRALAETLEDPAEVALLAAMAESGGEHQIALQVGKIAASRGLPVETLAFPIAAIPAATRMATVEKPVVYAIARQESAFNRGAVSRAGARGLLQLMPATAKQTAKNVGLAYSKDRLTADPAYNATLGAAHLGVLFDDFGGSYVMTFASYNAGSSRIYDWIKLHGDPRDPKTDVVNWIELIPFTETRNYVQRIMENLQVYRARLGSAALTIESDLKRGKIVPKTD